MIHHRFVLLAVAASVGTGCASNLAQSNSKPASTTRPTAPVSSNVDVLLKQMTPQEKLALVHADSKFTTAGVPRLGIPERWLDDGPHGVREDVGPFNWQPAGHTDDFITAMPNLLCLAATFDPDLAHKYGETIGEEARVRNKDILLGPAINIQRTPLCGRNFEYMGEDPQLTSEMATAYILGLQSRDVACSVKHFALNNQEDHRNDIDVHVSDRALHEIYLPGFEAAIKQGHALTVMAAYNKFRGTYCSANDLLLNQILKKEWGFQGLVMSDWGAVHETKGCVLGGMDLEMGSDNGKRGYDDFFMAKPYLDGIHSGEYTMAGLDDKARRNLYVMQQTHVLDPEHRFVGSMNTPQHQRTARSVAEAGMVLLKNDHSVLPLDASKTKTIAVIGELANRQIIHSGGSSELKSLYEITPLAGIVQRVGPAANVIYAQGIVLPTAAPRRRPATQYDAAGMRIDATQPSTAAAAAPSASELMDRAVAAAKSADVAIVVVGVGHGRNHDEEGADRKDLKLPYNQDALIDAVTKANPKSIVVLVSGGAVEMPWLEQTSGVLQMWYGGMEGGNALAEVLFGDAAPGGKLPCTFPKKLEDSPAHALGNYPGKDGVVDYAEGVFVGYRWFDEKKIEPLFPFGFGLSYTTFKYANVKVEAADSSGNPKLTVTFDITNTGSRPGSEVGQVYVHDDHAKVQRPPQELKGFAKVMLQPGETQHVKVALPPRALAYYDETSHGWTADPGMFEIRVGGNSREIQATASYELKQKVAVE